MKNVIISCFLLCFSFAAKARTIKWLDIEQKSVYRIDTEKNVIEKVTESNGWQTIGSVFLKNVDEKDIPIGNVIICLNTEDKNLIYLLIDCTNQVYQFNYKTLLLERIDKTFHRGFNCRSTRFIRNNTIYSFGGYGLFRTNCLLVYYQQDRQEWDAISFLNDAPKASYKGLSGYVKKSDSYYTGLNFCISDSESSGKIITDYGFYEYKFKENKWAKLGEIKQPKLRNIEEKNDRRFLWNGKYFIFRLYEQPFNRLIIIDPFLNEVYEWIDEKKLLNIDIHDEVETDYVHGDTLYSNRFFNTGTRDEASRIAISIEEAKKKATYIGELYEIENNNFWFLVAGIGLLIVFLVFYFMFFRDRHNSKNILLSSNTLNTEEIKMIEFLMQNHENGGITTEQINYLLNIDDKSVENQRKLRHEFVKSLNLKLKMIHNLDSAIERKPSSIDKRIFNYQLSNEMYQLLKK